MLIFAQDEKRLFTILYPSRIMNFTHLHVHSHYSILDGMSKVPDLIDKCVRTGMYSIALTDHGDMFGIKEFLDYAGKYNGKVKDKIRELEQKLASTETAETDKPALQEQLAATRAQIFKPIVGVEAYCAHTSLKNRKELDDRSGWHLILLAKNKKGYQNLCKLVSISWIDGFYYRPRIDKEILEKYHEGLIVCSACLGGEVPQKIMHDDMQGAEDTIRWFKSLFGDDYYLELQRHKTDKPNADQEVYQHQLVVNKALQELAEKTGTKLIATNDVHFVEEEHAEAHDRLICLSTGRFLDEAGRMHYTMQEWLKTPDEMAELFADIPQALENTQEIVNKIETYSIDSGPLMPMFDIPESFGTEAEYRQKFTEKQLFDEFTQDEKGNVVMSEDKAQKKVEALGGYGRLYRIKLEADYLAELAWKGAAERYEEMTDEIHERIVFELHIMKTMGFPGYFLIVQDFINAARKMGVSVGPGRGSAAGSVVAYCLHITDIDPLKYDLLFERFLNPDRISLPDIDIDFDDDGRAEVLRWVTEKYGKEKVAHIITYGTMATKSSIADVGRVQRVPLAVVNELKSYVPDKFDDSLADPKTGKVPKVNLKNCLKYVPELQKASQSEDRNISDVLKYATMLEGTVRQTGVHACGVIIGADDLTRFVPLSTAKEKGSDQDVLVTQYEGSVIESVGLIKMDFLGLKTLSIIKETLKNIKKSKGIDLDIDKIPIDDKATYELYSQGKTVGTFQFESAGMQKYLRELQPSTFEDLIAMNALYRPGPMQYIPQFIARKHGKEPIKYDIPIMEKYLKDTYGITVYQEQVMLLSRLLANFTRGESDTLRKAMGKKQKDKLDHMKPDFIERGKQNGHDPKVLEKIWADWEHFASYAFNKSHATCYSWVSYQTAYLKAHYPAEFMAANLTRNMDNIVEVAKFMDECKAMGINVLEPDVNESELHFSVNEAGHIRFGLGGIKGVGEGAAEMILNERQKNGKYKNIYDFVERVNLNTCNKKTIESLAFSGAFDSFEDAYREQYFVLNEKGEWAFDDNIMRYGNKYQSDAAFAGNSLFGDMETVPVMRPKLSATPRWSALYRLGREKEFIGMYLSAHPLDDYEFEIKYLCNATTSQLKDMDSCKGKVLRVGGVVTAVKQGTSQKTGKPYGFMTLEDQEGPYEFGLFGQTYIDFSKYLIKDLYLMVTVSAQQRMGFDRKPTDEWEMKIQKIEPLSDIASKMLRSLTLQIPINTLQPVWISELKDVLQQNKGDVPLYIQVYENKRNSVLFRSRSCPVRMTPELFRYLKKQKYDNQLDFTVNL